MLKKSIYKIPGGKIIKVSLEEEQGKINKVEISGDFFLYPEESIIILEKSLEGVCLDNAKEKIDEVIKNNKLQLFGLSAEGIVQALKLAK